MLRRAGLVAIACSALSAAAAAQRSTELALGWADLVRLLDQHPRLAVGRAQVAAAEGGARAAGAVPNPTLEASLGRGYAHVGTDSRFEWGLALAIPLGWLAQRRPRMEAAQAQVDAATADLAATRRDVLLQLGPLYWQLAHEQARVRALEALRAQTAELARLVGRRVQTGEARPVEAPRIEVELEKVTVELEAARTSLEARRAQLGVWLRLPPGTTVAAASALSARPMPIDREKILPWARRHHPLLAALRARVRGLEAELTTEKLVRVPPVGLRGFAAHELERRTYGVGLAVELPVWNWNSGRIAQAGARLAAERSQLEAATLELEASLLEAEAACRSGIRASDRLGGGVLPRSEKTAATVERMYRLGEASLLEVIDARRTFLDARRSYLAVIAQAQMDCSRLRAILGKELP